MLCSVAIATELPSSGIIVPAEATERSEPVTAMLVIIVFFILVVLGRGDPELIISSCEELICGNTIARRMPTFSQGLLIPFFKRDFGVFVS